MPYLSRRFWKGLEHHGEASPQRRYGGVKPSMALTPYLVRLGPALGSDSCDSFTMH